MNRARNLRGATEGAKAVAGGKPSLSCSVISDKDLLHIHELVDKKPAAEIDKDRRDVLRQVSDKRVAHWPNTIEAQRVRKEEARQARLEKEEERRRIIDQEESDLRNAQKAAAIQKANVQLYEENDKVKNFTSKLFLSTVLEEREKQLAVKKEKELAVQEAELDWVLQEKATLRKAEAEEVQKLHVLAGKRQALRDAQVQQLADIRVQKIKERDTSVAEGAKIRIAAEQAVKEDEELEVARRDAQKKAARGFIAGNEAQRALKAEAAERENLETEKIIQFAEQKEVQMLERKKRADEKFAAKLRRRQDLIDEQAKQLAELKAAVEEKELRAMRDFERERGEREELEREQRLRRQREIESFRSAQKKMKEKQDAKESEERSRMKDIWRQRAEILIDEELQEKRQDREKAETLQRFQLLQRQEKRYQSLHDKGADIEEGIRLQEALKEEQEMYNNYVNSVMGEYVRKGRDAEVVRNAANRSKTHSA
jgi:hypothetical protein